MSANPKSAKKAQSVAGGSPVVGGEKLTDRELLILSKAWGCMKTQPEIDMPKLAQELNMTNVGSATNAWGRIKKKLFTGAIDSPGGVGRKRKAPAAAAADDDDDDDEDDDQNDQSPTKRAKPAAATRKKPGRKPKAPAAPAAAVRKGADVDGDGDDSSGEGEGAKKEAKNEDGYIKPEKQDHDDDDEGDLAGTA